GDGPVQRLRAEQRAAPAPRRSRIADRNATGCRRTGRRPHGAATRRISRRSWRALETAARHDQFPYTRHSAGARRMNIGEASDTTGLPVKTIRYYEEIGLVAPDRGNNGYRDFSGQQLTRLRFLSQARSLGFSLEECRRLMGLYCDENRASRDVRDLAEAHLSDI